MNTPLEQYAQSLKEREAQDRLRRLRPARPAGPGLIELNGRTLVNFASNDYLGLSRHPLLVSRAAEFAGLYGAGSCSSRLLSGNLTVFEQVESKLAKLKGCESALILSTGFQANSTVIPALLDKTNVAVADRLVHRSIIEGLRLSSARWSRFEHNNLAEAKERLSGMQTQGGRRWLLTESVFSADGDRVDLPSLLKLAGDLSLALFIDEAHATGLFGANGMGLTAGQSVPGITMGTFGKGLGSFGAYVCSSALIREYLINFCAGLIYSTALPPPVLGAIDAALDLIPEMDAEREQLQQRAAGLRDSLSKLGFDTGSSTTHIIPIMVGQAGSALALSTYLEESGFFVPAIRPPAVAEGKSRLRLSLTACHTKEQIEDFLKAVRKWHDNK